jgi:drug/metabolite transporter (DMT)-like permease
VPHKSDNILLGWCYGLLGAVLFALMAFTVHIAPQTLSSSQIVFYRGLVGIVILSWFCRRELGYLGKSVAWPLWLRGAAGGLAVTCYFINLRLVNAAIASVLQSLAPLFVAMIGLVIGQQKTRFSDIAGAVITTIGITLIISPSGAGISLASVLIGLAGSFLGAVAYLSLKTSTNSYSPTLIVWTMSLALVLFPMGSFSPSWFSVNLLEFGSLVLVGVFSLVAQLYMTKSYYVLTAQVASTINLTSTAWLLLLDALVGNVHYTLGALAGFICVLTGLVVLRRKRKSVIPANP